MNSADLPSENPPTNSGPAPVPQSVPAVPERRGPDRRKRPTPMFSRYTIFGGRRAADRRSPNAEGQFVDRYDSSFFLFLAAIALFNLFDCFFTLVQIERGAEELNPFAQMLIDKGPSVFVLTKSLGVGLIICFLCLHKNFKLARYTLWFAFAMYLGIFIYHLVLYGIAISSHAH